MKPFRISYIQTTLPNQKHPHIQAIGGYFQNGKTWRLSAQDAISGIEAGLWSFYININDNPVDIVVLNTSGEKSLGSHPDLGSRNLLLNLPCVPTTNSHHSYLKRVNLMTMSSRSH